MTAQNLRLADLLVAISVATDIGMGYEPDKAIRSCVVATGLARSLGLRDADLRDVYLTTLLRHLGCTATANEEAFLFGGDELASRPGGERTDFGNPLEALRLTMATGRGTGLARPRYLARSLRASRTVDERIFRPICEVGSLLARRLGLSGTVQTSLTQVFERWDGKGSPDRIKGEGIALPARLAEVATQAVIFDRLGGTDAALEVIGRRAGGWFDPAIVDAFVATGPDLLGEVNASDPWTIVLEAEPEPHTVVGPEGIDRIARTFADMVDLKSTYTLGHSSGVAELATGAARSLRMTDAEVTDLRRAAWLHDVGRVGVSAAVWERRGRLTELDLEAIRLHPYHTERILGRSAALSPLVRIAGMHHERQDGSGYHRGASGSEIPQGARLLAAADAYHAMTQERPHRPARPAEEAAAVLADEASAGRLDPDCARAVAEAGGVPIRVKTELPAGLSAREVEVLRLVAAGHSNREIATRLVISPRTAEHHVQNIYTKIGTSTRAAAAVFAMEHDLLGAPSEDR